MQFNEMPQLYPMVVRMVVEKKTDWTKSQLREKFCEVMLTPASTQSDTTSSYSIARSDIATGFTLLCTAANYRLLWECRSLI